MPTETGYTTAFLVSAGVALAALGASGAIRHTRPAPPTIPAEAEGADV
jgi:hypothetical protein